MTKKVLVIAGDGIGKEVTIWGKRVLEKVAAMEKIAIAFDDAQLGHQAIESEGVPLPDSTLQKAKASDAILFGAIGHPKYDQNPEKYKIRPEQGLLEIRKSLGLYANIRPIFIFDSLISASPLKRDIVKDTDILFYRELIGGIYFGKKSLAKDYASDLMAYSRAEVERIAHKAFLSARKRRKKICSIDKANVLSTSVLWRSVVNQVSQHYPDIQCTHLFVDNAAMQIIRDPKQFDVILTSNLFGDILSDLASQIVGSLGMLASISMGGKTSFYEPIHGSAYDIAGKKIANPLASILSVALMVEHTFGLPKAAKKIYGAINNVLDQGYRTADLADEKGSVVGTDQMGTLVLEAIK